MLSACRPEQTTQAARTLVAADEDGEMCGVT